LAGPSGPAGANGPTSNVYSITAVNYNAGNNNFTIPDTDQHEVFLIQHGGGVVTVALPLSTAAPAGKRISIVIDNPSATPGQFQVRSQGADQILQDPTLKTLIGPANYGATLVSNGAGLWRIVSFL
jgi:hypothetical protein